MCTPFAQRLLGSAFVLALAACSSDLTLPDDRTPAELKAVSGDGQTGTVGSRLDDPLIVALTDASRRPVAGVPIEFRFQSDVPEAELDQTGITDDQGQARAEVRLGSSTGALTVVARVVEADELRATFGLTALEREKGKKKDKDDDDRDDNDDDDDEEDGDGED